MIRSRISRAALLVKVTASSSHGLGPAGRQDVGQPGGQHAGLAGAGAGQHQHRAVDGLDGGALLGVQPLQIVRPRSTRARSLTRASGEGAVGKRFGDSVGDIGTYVAHGRLQLRPEPR